MELVEVVPGLTTDPATLSIVLETAKAWNKIPVETRSTPGFIVNRVARPFYAEALRLATEGSDPATIDYVMSEAGRFPMGPFELMDLIGNDVNFAVTQSVFDGFYHDPRFTPSLYQQAFVEAGFLGRKTGRGFYDYGDDSTKGEPALEARQSPPNEIWLSDGDSLTNGLLTRLRKTFPAAGAGPFQWSRKIGLRRIHTVLHNLSAYYGEDRYRTSPLIKSNLWIGKQLDEP
jgi:3-hydroxybutyryl-CoA dehydrogenase